MSTVELLQQLQTSRDYLYELFDQEERKELKLALRLISQEIRRLDGGGEEIIDDDPMGGMESLLDIPPQAANTGRQPVIPATQTAAAKARFNSEPASDKRDSMFMEEKPSLEEWNELVRQREEAMRREKDAELQRQQQQQAAELQAQQIAEQVEERLRALKADMIRVEDERLKLMDAKEVEAAKLDSQIQKINIRKAGIGRRKDQTLKDEQATREERARRKKEALDDDKALNDVRATIARLQQELAAANQQEEELKAKFAKHETRAKNEELALKEIQSRRQELTEDEQQAERQSEELQRQRAGLDQEYAARRSAFEDEFLKKHWQTPPLNEKHLQDALKACATLLSVKEKDVRKRLEHLGLTENLGIATATDATPANQTRSSTAAALENFLKLVKL